ncbi:unnamed protein product [Owenia fusiformis]|nr:unnamed protein product [Owenia fusiformis]
MEDDPNDGQTETYSYEDALKLTGYGKFHMLVLALSGWAVSSDAVEVLAISFVLPSAECDLRMSSSDKGLLNALLFVGMMIGGFCWGTLADIKGRRGIVIWSLAVNGLAGLGSAFAQSYWLFLLLRFISGIGVGGSIPVVFSYFSEWQCKERRGSMISLLSTFWMCGNVLTAAIAWAVIPHPNLGYFSSTFTFNSWRIFVVLATFPALTASLLYIFMPESPKFLLMQGNDKAALAILANVYQRNKGTQNQYPVERLERFMYEDESEAKYTLLKMRGNSCMQMFRRMQHTVIKIFQTAITMFKQPYTRSSLIMWFINFSICFGYYGLFLWLPELFKRLELGEGSVCYTPSANTTSHNSNSTCTDAGLDTNIYSESMLTALANLPGNILTIFLMDKIGRKILLTSSMIISGVSVFFIYLVHNKVESLVMSCVFSGFSTIGFNAINVVQVELYPTQLRSTAYGILTGTCRIGAIVGNLIFGQLVDVNCAVPMLMVAGLLSSGGLMAIKLPNKTQQDIN